VLVFIRIHVSDKVSIVSRRAGETSATLWESTGEGSYTLTETESRVPGREITLHLKAA